jgi:DNA-binding CsgD family transcriptional regulator
MTENPPQSQRAKNRAEHKQRRAERLARRENYFDLLASGYSCRQIAEAAKVSLATVQRAIDRAIDERRLDAPERYAHVQVARLTKALRLADASVERGELKALAPFLKLVAALDRYHGLAPGASAAPRGPAPRPARAAAGADL